MAEIRDLDPQAFASQRRYDIDWLRTLALGLLIIYHIAIAFQPFAPFIAFIQNEPTLEILWAPMQMLNVWRIPILFLISGMGAAFAMRRRSWRALLNDRTTRILLPLIFGSIFIAPITLYLASIWYNWNGDGSGSYFPNAVHLWFLGNIYLYVLLLLPLFSFFKNRPENLFLNSIRQIFRWPLGIFIVTIPVVLETLLVSPWSFETYANTLHGLCLGLILFLTGFIFISVESDFWPAVTRHRFVALIIAVALYVFRLVNEETAIWLIGIESTCWMLAILGFGALYLNQPSEPLRYLSCAVYPIYIIHLPIQTALSYLLFPTGLPAWLKFILLVGGTFAVAFTLYELLLRRISWMRPLFGMKVKRSSTTPSADHTETQDKLGWGAILGVSITALLLLAGLLLSLLSFLSNSFLNQASEAELTSGTAARFRAESQARSAEESLAEIDRLLETFNTALEEGDSSRARILAMEIFIILHVVENPESEGIEPEIDGQIDVLEREAAARDERASYGTLFDLMSPLKEALDTREIGPAKDIALEMYVILRVIEDE